MSKNTPIERDALIDALRPFAALMKPHHENLPDDRIIFQMGDDAITVGHLRKASAYASYDETPMMRALVSVVRFCDLADLAMTARTGSSFMSQNSPLANNWLNQARIAVKGNANDLTCKILLQNLVSHAHMHSDYWKTSYQVENVRVEMPLAEVRAALGVEEKRIRKGPRLS